MLSSGVGSGSSTSLLGSTSAVDVSGGLSLVRSFDGFRFDLGHVAGMVSFVVWRPPVLMQGCTAGHWEGWGCAAMRSIC